MSSVSHVSVLLEESITGLCITPGDIVVDCTFGGGGHTREILARYTQIKLIAVDLDERASERFVESGLAQAGETTCVFVQANFKDVDRILASGGATGANRVLMDLGTSAFQLKDDDRGFSFASGAPLQMTFSKAGSHTGFTAHDIANEWEAESIADILYAYADERRSRTIAKAIVEARRAGEIKMSSQLAAIVESAIGKRGKTHPATKTFQAIRIAVNDEIGVLKTALEGWWNVVTPGGRIAVITFHSLEDRIVKRWMREVGGATIITKKPIAPSRGELLINPRARSAKLRIIEKNRDDI